MYIRFFFFPSSFFCIRIQRDLLKLLFLLDQGTVTILKGRKICVLPERSITILLSSRTTKIHQIHVKDLIIAIKFYDNYLCSWLNLLIEFWIWLDNLTESLMFLAHFVGDIHQPLHVGFEEDEGGNTIIVHWYRRKSNLHHVKQLPCSHPLVMVQFSWQWIILTSTLL